jgi:hypothetical protein
MSNDYDPTAEMAILAGILTQKYDYADLLNEGLTVDSFGIEENRKLYNAIVRADTLSPGYYHLAEQGISIPPLLVEYGKSIVTGDYSSHLSKLRECHVTRLNKIKSVEVQKLMALGDEEGVQELLRSWRVERHRILNVGGYLGLVGVSEGYLGLDGVSEGQSGVSSGLIGGYSGVNQGLAGGIPGVSSEGSTLKSKVWEVLEDQADGWVTAPEIFDILYPGMKDAVFKKKTKKKIRDYLSDLFKKGKVLREEKGKEKGKYRKTEEEEEDFEDWKKEDQEDYGIYLPLNLHEEVLILNGDCILVEGSTNAGKTAFCLQTIGMNLTNDKPILYIYAEGTTGMFKKKLSMITQVAKEHLTDVLSKRVRATQKGGDQDLCIRQHNHGGIAIVDYISPKDGEYYRLATQVKEIQEALNGVGVAIACVQKASNQQVGRGGEGIRERPILCLTLDHKESFGGITFGVATIRKCKIPKNDGCSLDHRKCLFSIIYGARMEMVVPWGIYSDAEINTLYLEALKREKKNHEHLKEELKEYVFCFNTDEGDVNLNREDFERWKATYPHINVKDELERLAAQSKRGAISLKKKNWFFQVAGMLKRLNDNAERVIDADEAFMEAQFHVQQG